MKTIFDRYLTSAAALYLVFIISIVVLLTSCSTTKHWYSKSHDGCQQSSGFSGYGNK